VLVEKLKSYRFVIVEFLDEKSTDVVPSIWISVDNTLQQFVCQWPNSLALLKNHFLIGKAIFVVLGNFLVSLFF